MAIHLLQCLCPERHCITALLYDDATADPADTLLGFQSLVEEAVQRRVLRQRCAVCNKDAPFHYGDTVTGIKDMEQAKIVAAHLEAEQMATRLAIDASKN